MKLAPTAVRARAGKRVHVALGWSHPKAGLRASRQMAGRSFPLEVQATDIRGHRQDEPVAGRLIVAA